MNKEIEAIREDVGLCKRAGFVTALSVSDAEKLLAEIDRLKSIVDAYAVSARTIALYLKPYCNESLPYGEMIADASRKASAEIDRLQDELDGMRLFIQDICNYIPEDYCDGSRVRTEIDEYIERCLPLDGAE